MKKLLLITVLTVVSLLLSPLGGQEHHWYSHTDVVKEVKSKFQEMETYTANFRIVTEKGKRIRTMSGRLYYKKPNKVRFAFNQPAGNLMVSDGRILYIYIRHLNAVGKQDLRLQKKDESGRFIFAGTPGPGLVRLFRKYHYHFDTTEQPRKFEGRDVFVLDLKQREKIGGYENIKLFIDAHTYLIYRAIARDGYGKETTITFEQTRLNEPLDGNLFQYEPGQNVRVVNNPLVNE